MAGPRCRCSFGALKCNLEVRRARRPRVRGCPSYGLAVHTQQVPRFTTDIWLLLAIAVAAGWAVALGAIFFNETPDAIGYLGLAILVASGIATVFSDGTQARIMGRWSEFRARRGEPQTPIEGPDL